MAHHGIPGTKKTNVLVEQTTESITKPTTTAMTTSLLKHLLLVFSLPARTKAGRWCVGRRALTLSPQTVFRLMPAVWRAGWQQGDQVVWGSLGLLVIIIISNNTTCSSATPWQPAGCVSARGCMRGRGNSQTVAVGSQARANESATDRCKVALGARQRQ